MVLYNLIFLAILGFLDYIAHCYNIFQKFN
jgi:glycerol-3-phosphate acyltransferase PlsY